MISYYIILELPPRPPPARLRRTAAPAGRPGLPGEGRLELQLNSLII